MLTRNAAVAPESAERRLADRTQVGCPAQLHLTTGIRVGTLWDLSQTGARVHTAEPPRPGTTALLKWQANEAFCKVVWSRDDMCGIAFDRPLKDGMVSETLREQIHRAGPVASVGKIPLGQKRSRF
jgi:hypothetical protein